MIKRGSQSLCAWFIAWDVALTAGAWLAAYAIRFHSGLLPLIKDTPDFWLCVRGLPQVLLCAVVAYMLAGQYQIHRLRRFREELQSVVQGVGLMLLLTMATSFYLHDPYETRLTMLVFSALAFAGVLGMRRLTWTIIRKLRSRGFNQSRAIIVGTGRVARRTARALRHAHWMGIRNVGFVDDPHNGPQVSPPDRIGTIADLPALIDAHTVEHVFIALPMSRFAEARRVFDVLSQQLVDVRMVVDVPNLASLALTTTTVDGLPLVGLRESPHHGLNVVVKRTMDILLAAVAIVLLAPVMLAVAVAVKLTSRGPILFAQERCGLNGRSFGMLKFRSMRTDAEQGTGAVMTQANDPRRTLIGGFLRKTSLDELPQLFNVLRGDMSLVGPRPERPEFIKDFRKTIPNYMARHAVKAGITGWAQVNGWRGNTSLRRRIQFDLYYIAHWNPLFDLRILVLTVLKMLFHRHAY